MGTEVVIPHIMILLQGASANVLIDTGFGDPEAIAAAYPQQLWRTPDQTPQQLLARLDLQPADIDLVINTHLHYDHVGNNHLFPHATQLAQRADLEFSVAPRVPLMEREFFSSCGGYPAQYNPTALTPVYGDHTVLPDLDILSLPGHTPGNQGVVFVTEHGSLCFAGDLVMVTENLDPLTPVGLHTDLEACERSRSKVLETGGRVIPSHDLRLFAGGGDIEALC
jgi:glyoxylase-like metal-dependent hydrolase (beta-lactamase superfamily II)